MPVPQRTIRISDVPIDLLRRSDEQVQSIVAAAKASVDAGRPGLSSSLAIVVESLIDEYSDMSAALWDDVAAAEAQGRGTFDVELDAPVTMASACDTWLQLLDHLEELLVAGEFEHPPTPPEIRTFRRWLVDHITSQLRDPAPAAS
jgi:hypothetical protein